MTCAHPAGFVRRVLAAVTDRGWDAPPDRLEEVRRAVRRLERNPPGLGEGVGFGHMRP
jgi:hypothetical protein